MVFGGTHRLGHVCVVRAALGQASTCSAAVNVLCESSAKAISKRGSTSPVCVVHGSTSPVCVVRICWPPSLPPGRLNARRLAGATASRRRADQSAVPSSSGSRGVTPQITPVGSRSWSSTAERSARPASPSVVQVMTRLDAGYGSPTAAALFLALRKEGGMAHPSPAATLPGEHSTAALAPTHRPPRHLSRS